MSSTIFHDGDYNGKQDDVPALMNLRSRAVIDLLWDRS